MTRASALALALILAAGPVSAQPAEPAPPPSLIPEPPDIVRESARRFLESVRRLIDQMPVFEAPRITPEGDIIIRRVRPPFPEGEEARSLEPIHEGVDL
jgi:hypothetical protein